MMCGLQPISLGLRKLLRRGHTGQRTQPRPIRGALRALPLLALFFANRSSLALNKARRERNTLPESITVDNVLNASVFLVADTVRVRTARCAACL